MTTKALTKSFLNRHIVKDIERITVDERTQYVILARYSDARESEIIGAVSSEDTLYMFMEALTYYACNTKAVYMSENIIQHNHAIRSMYSDRYINVRWVRLDDNDTTISNTGVVSLSLNRLTAGCSLINEFDNAEANKE